MKITDLFHGWWGPHSYHSWWSKVLQTDLALMKNITVVLDRHRHSHRSHLRTCRQQVVAEAGSLWNSVDVTAAGPQVKLANRSSVTMATSCKNTATANSTMHVCCTTDDTNLLIIWVNEHRYLDPERGPNRYKRCSLSCSSSCCYQIFETLKLC